MQKAKNTTHIRVNDNWYTYQANQVVPDEHVSYFKNKKSELVYEVPKEMNVVEELHIKPQIKWTYSKLKELNSKEQRLMLKNLGCKSIPRKEENRINKILEMLKNG